MVLITSREQMDKIIQLLQGQNKSEPLKEVTINTILEIVKDLQKKLDEQNRVLMKIVAVISKMYQDNEINKDTFNKLDEFLKPYYDNPYQDDNY